MATTNMKIRQTWRKSQGGPHYQYLCTDKLRWEDQALQYRSGKIEPLFWDEE
jgi:hypothetical protein